MIRKLIPLFLILALFTPLVMADDAETPTLTVKSDLELFYESSSDVGGDGDGDAFKTTQLYFDFLGDFGNGLYALLKVDGADVINSDGRTVTKNIIEEANFTWKHIGDSPVTLVFGKDEMPFGLDYDKYLNDSVAHSFEIDKLWGIHGIVDLPVVDDDPIGNIAIATYQHRHKYAAGVSTVEADNEAGDNFTARLTLDKLIKMVKVNVSASSESYADTTSTDADTGATTVSEMDTETRLGAGLVLTCPKDLGNINVEYISFNNQKGVPDYDPALLTIGIEGNINDQVIAYGRWENIIDDTDVDVETDFWTIGVSYEAAPGCRLMAEYSNFNSGDMSDAADLIVADGSIEDSLRIGVRATF